MSLWLVLLKYGKFASLILLAITFIVLPLFSGISTLIETGNYKPLLHDTVGRFIASDQSIKLNVEELTNKEQIEKFPEKYTEGYVNHLRQEIIFSLLVMIFWIVGLYLLLTKGILSEANLDILVKILVLVASIVIVYVMTLIYSAVFFNQFYYPYHGLVSLIANFGQIFSTSLIQSTVTSPAIVDTAMNTTGNITHTILQI